MELANLLLDPLQSGIGRRALLEIVLLAAVCGGLSFWILALRMSYPAESLSHGLLPGLVVAALAGAPLLLGAGAGVAAAAGAVTLAGRDERVGQDAGTAIVVSGMFGLGALLALSPEAPARLEELLFGDPLGVGDGDLIAAGVLAALGAPALAGLHRPLCAVALDPAAARGNGISPLLVRLALALLLAAALAVAVQGLGSLLVLAVLIAPAAAVGGRSLSPGRSIFAAAAVAIVAGVGGIYASSALGSAAGASIALALCAAVAIGRLPALSRAVQAGRAAPRPR